MSWPTANDYFEAIQHPLRRFCKAELKRAHAALDGAGKPVVRPGKRMDVYELRGSGGVESWAIGCLLRQPRALAARFELINEHLQQHPVPSLVESEYHQQGICIRGKWYPIIRSRWTAGRPLNAFVREHLDRPDQLRLLAEAFVQVAYELHQAGIAHGNLATDTVLVVPAPGPLPALKLVDYDALFVPALAELPPDEMGHPDFQHPSRGWQRVYNAEADRFAQLVVQTALAALTRDGAALWNRFDNGENLLFCRADFEEPTHSPLFRELWQADDAVVRTLAGRLLLACHGAANEVPPFDFGADMSQPDSVGQTLSAYHIEEINKLLELDSFQQNIDIDVGETTLLVPGAGDDFAIDVEDVVKPAGVVPAATGQSLPKQALPPAPAAPAQQPAAAPRHPLTHSYQLDAWMPEQVAVFKLQGFVKNACGEVVSSIPGYVRVHLLDGSGVSAKPSGNLLTWLGLYRQPPPEPRILAVMELQLVHKPTPTRQLIGITVLLAPGQEDVEPSRWKDYCDRIFCELRGHMIGFIVASCSS